MNKALLLIVFISCALTAGAQHADTTRSWEASLEVDNNFLTDQYLVGMIGIFDRKWLHAEARYNSEDFRTFSFWLGYNFSGGNEFTYTFTPMVGFMVGNSYGILPGVGVSLEYKRWSFTNETAVVVYDSFRSEENYIYTSNELDFSIDETFYVGLSLSRSKVFHSSLELQKGIGGGFTKGKISASAYVYDLFITQPFGFLSVTYNF